MSAVFECVTCGGPCRMSSAPKLRSSSVILAEIARFEALICGLHQELDEREKLPTEDVMVWYEPPEPVKLAPVDLVHADDALRRGRDLLDAQLIDGLEALRQSGGLPK